MFILTIIVVFLSMVLYHVFSFPITLDERPLDNEDFRLIDKHMNLTQCNNDEHDIQVKTVRMYLMFGYIGLLLFEVYVCKSCIKSDKYKPIPESDQ